MLHTESPQSLLMFGLRREVLEGKALEPRQILAELDKVTAKDIQRVAQDLIDRKKLHLAVIGPFDDESRFRDLLAGRRRRKPAAKPAAKAAAAKPRATAARGEAGATATRRTAAAKPKRSPRSARLGRFGQFQVARRAPAPARAAAGGRAGCSRPARRSSAGAGELGPSGR